MAPEQAAGGTVDARTDIFALGIVLRVLATGCVPSVSLDTCADFEIGLPAPLPSAPVPEWLYAIVDRCCAEVPSDRFQSMNALDEALAAAVVTGRSLREIAGIPSPALSRRPDTNLDEGEADPFVGREAEVASIASHLASPGLWTLKGPAGIGKTRLAREAVRRCAARSTGAGTCSPTWSSAPSRTCRPSEAGSPCKRRRLC